jgi:hypothetical protein
MKIEAVGVGTAIVSSVLVGILLQAILGVEVVQWMSGVDHELI